MKRDDYHDWISNTNHFDPGSPFYGMGPDCAGAGLPSYDEFSKESDDGEVNQEHQKPHMTPRDIELETTMPVMIVFWGSVIIIPLIAFICSLFK